MPRHAPELALALQRAAGNRAAAAWLTQASGRRIQRLLHGTNWQTYVTNYATANGLLADPTYAPALAAAVKLDVAVVRVPATVLTNIAFVPGTAWWQFWAAPVPPVPAHIGELDTIRALILAGGGAAATESEFNWSPMIAGDEFGTGVRAKIRQNRPVGSGPTIGSINGWAQLNHRKKVGSNTTLWAKGHLLHDYLGGPGLDYNLVPLTADPDGASGANHANWAMRHVAEGPVKGAVDKIPATVNQVDYEVTTVWGNHGRAGQIAQLTQAAADYNVHMTAINITASGSGPGGQARHSDVMGSLNPANPSPTRSAILAVRPTHNQLGTVVQQRMVDNRDLWMFEDTHTPIGVQIQFSWVEQGNLVSQGPHPIPNILPSELKTPYS